MSVVLLIAALIGVLGAMPRSAASAREQFRNVSAPPEQQTGATSAGMEYYVDANRGNDNNPGTIDSPFQTINKAAGMVGPGDTVVIREGVYRETITDLVSGTADAPITFTAYGNEHVVVSGAVEVGGWQDPEGDGIYEALVAAPPAEDLKPENYQVFVNGQMVHQSREPEIANHNDPFSQEWLKMVKGVAVSIQSMSGSGGWLSAKNGGGEDVAADAAAPGIEEEFYLIDTNAGDLESGDEVGFLTSSHKHYLSAENGGRLGTEDKLESVEGVLYNYERFNIIKLRGSAGSKILPGDIIALQTLRKGYLSTGVDVCGTEVYANGPSSEGICNQFMILIKYGGAINIQTANGKYLNAVNGGGGAVRANRSADALTWERNRTLEFYLIDTNGGFLQSGDKVGFLTPDHEHYLAAKIGGYGDPNDKLVADRTELDVWEQFTITSTTPGDTYITPGDTVTLQAFGGRYLSAARDSADNTCGGGDILANSSDPGGECEKFTVTIHPEPLVLFDETTVDFESSNNALAGSYVWGVFRSHPYGQYENGNEDDLVGWGGGAMSLARVIGSAPGKLVLGETGKGWLSEGSRQDTLGNGVIIGGVETLDTYYEWRYDEDSGKLSLKIPSWDLNGLKVEFRQRTWGVDLGFNNKNEPDVKTSHVIFRNIDFFGGQLRIYGDHNLLDNVRVTYGSHYIYRRSYNEYADIDLGFNGVYLKGDDNTTRNSEIAFSAGNGISFEGDRNTVENCLIHDFGYMGPFSSGVYFKGPESIFDSSTGSKVTYSTLFNSGRDTLLLTNCQECKITHNYLYESLLLTNDGGTIYSYGHNLKGTEIAYNWIQSATNRPRSLGLPPILLGIYPDNLTRQAIVHHNVIMGLTDEAGIGPNTPHEGHLICNNTIIHNRLPSPQSNYDQIGVNAFCGCNEDDQPGLSNRYFEGKGECIHTTTDAGTTSKCTHLEYTYWINPDHPNASTEVNPLRLQVHNTLYYASFEEASIDLVNPQEVQVGKNGWEIIGQPDFRPKIDSYLIDAGKACVGTKENDSGQQEPIIIEGDLGENNDIGAYEYNGTNWIPGYRAVPRVPHNDFCPHAPVLDVGDAASGRVSAVTGMSGDSYKLHMASDGYVLLHGNVKVDGWFRRGEVEFTIEDMYNGDDIAHRGIAREGLMFTSLGAGDYCLWVTPDISTLGWRKADYRLTLSSPLLISAAAQNFGTGNVDGIRFQSGDILAWSRLNNGEERWDMFFDASDVGIEGNVTNIAVEGDLSDRILLTVSSVPQLPGIGPVRPMDVIRFDPEPDGIGEDTGGQFMWVFRGNEHELTTPSEKIDAIDGWVSGANYGSTPCNGLPISTVGNAKVLTWENEDLATQKDDALFCLKYDELIDGWGPWVEWMPTGWSLAEENTFPDMDIVAVALDDTRRYDSLYVVSSPSGSFWDLVQWVNSDGSGWEHDWYEVGVTQKDIWYFRPQYWLDDVTHVVAWHGPDHGWDYDIDAIEWNGR
jgi:hypothetical protein